MKRVEIFDSTLRDGAQAEGISFSVQDKLNIVRMLDAFGVDYIEAGNPGSNPKDLAFFEEVAALPLKTRLCAFGSTCKKGVRPQDDQNLKSLLAANTPSVAVFGKSWDLHALEILRITREENLAIIENTLAFCKQAGKEVIFDAEHFFDGAKANHDYAFLVLEAALRGGADVLALCDTNGGTTPIEIQRLTKEVTDRFPGVRVGIHCHNDAGCAVANSLLAVEAGAVQVQGTFIGYGERCGNADLSALIPGLLLKMGRSAGCRLELLTETARKVAEVSNLSLGSEKPYVGSSAFAHKAGMHMDAVHKLPASFEHVSPEKVGNHRRFLVSEVAGRSAVLEKIRHIAPGLSKDSPQLKEIVEKLKEKEHAGYQYEAAEASFMLLVKKAMDIYRPHFSLVMYKTTGEYPNQNGDTSSAMVSIQVAGSTETNAAVGKGPVHALDSALRKALGVFYPSLAGMHLTDYKVRVLDNGATAAVVRVLLESTDGSEVWTTVGVSADIIEASWLALVDSIEYKLAKDDDLKEETPCPKP